MSMPMRKPRLDYSPVRTWIRHARPESEIRADLKRMLTEQIEAANKRLLQGPSSTESK